MTGQTELRESSASVVVMGSFNPLIFQPEWLEDNEIIGAKEADAARTSGIEVIHRQLVILNLSYSMRLEVSLSRFMIVSKESPTVLARDFALKCFKTLAHTPVNQLGINFGAVFRANSAAAWHNFGDALAPKASWKAFLGEVDSKRTGGLAAMQMQRTYRPDKYIGMQNVNIGVTDVAAMDTGVEFNDHYELAGATNSERVSQLVNLLELQWDLAEAKASLITKELRELCVVN